MNFTPSSPCTPAIPVRSVRRVRVGKKGNSVSRPFLVHHSIWAYFALREGDWKYVEGRGSGGFGRRPKIEVAASDPAKGQLYNLKRDERETQNVYTQYPERVEHFQQTMERLRSSHSLRPGYAENYR